jgi:hypothetical protein
MNRVAGLSIGVGLVGLVVTGWVVFGLLMIFGVIWIAVSWARPEAGLPPNQGTWAEADDLRRADDEDTSPTFGDAVPKSSSLGDGGLF